jgi:signal transduction histidine kinase
LNKTRDHLIRFGKENGVVIIDEDRLVVRSGYKASDGNLFFCDGNGYYSFYPNKLETLPGESKLYFTSFWLNNRAIKPDSTGPLPQSLDHTKQIQLDHHQNVFAFSFSTINFRSSEDKIMSYTLENYDVDWRQTGMGEKVNYFKVPPGNYIFRIKALNSATGTSLEKSIDVIISPPWWETWWAYILYAIAAVATLVFARQQVVNRERLNSRMKLEHMELEKAREMEQVKSRFFANISHEFRTPLTLLLGPIREMLSQASDYGQKNRLKMMERNAKQLLNLVNQLLELSKLEASKLKLEAVKSDVVSFIHALGSAFGSLADHKRIEYRFNLFEGKIGLYFDRNKLETIVNNLLSNAFKFTPEGGKVDLALKKLIEGDKEWVEIRVIDSGHGIPEDQIEKIFDRFYQTDSSQTREQEGTGIGLALTKELIKLHHGSIQVQSEMGKGTTFVILLPVGKDHLKEEEIIQELPLPDLKKEKGLTTHPSEFVLSWRQKVCFLLC